MLITNITFSTLRTLPSLRYLKNPWGISKTPKPEGFRKIVVVFLSFTSVAQPKAFWIQHQKLSLETSLSNYQTLNRLFRGARN